MHFILSFFGHHPRYFGDRVAPKRSGLHGSLFARPSIPKLRDYGRHHFVPTLPPTLRGSIGADAKKFKLYATK